MLFDNLPKPLKPPPYNFGILRSSTRRIKGLLGDYIKPMPMHKAPYPLIPYNSRRGRVKGAAYRAPRGELREAF